MDTLLSVRVFVEIVQQGSFTQAANRLGISVAMASKHLTHLEKQINARLLHRNNRRLHLTEVGEMYYRQCCSALETLDMAAQKAAAESDKPQGLLRMTMPLWFANPYMAGLFAEYRRLYPDVVLDLCLNNHHVDLIQDGFDLALRVSKELHPSLIVKQLTRIKFFLVAAPDYLRRYGLPRTPDEVNRCLAVLPNYTDMRHVMVDHHSGASAMLSLQACFSSDNTLMCQQLIQAGCGIGYLPEWAIREDLKQGRLVRLLPDYTIPDFPLYAAYVDRVYLSAKVRTMIDFLSSQI